MEENKDKAQEVSILDTSNQHLRDLRLAIEFKYLMGHAPGGVYMMPHLDDIRQHFGVIFVRRGIYRNGVFRFHMILPPEYNSIGSVPKVFFTTHVFNPLVDEKTGELKLTCDENLRDWNPKKHFLISVLVFLKKIFYMKSYDEYENVPNSTARDMFNSNKEEYMNRAASCVEASLSRVYEAQPAGSTLTFTEPKQVHDDVRNRVYGVGKYKDERSRAVDHALSASPSVGAASLLAALTPPRLAERPSVEPDGAAPESIPFKLDEALGSM